MYDFSVSAGSKAELYHDLLAALDALTADEPDPIANQRRQTPSMRLRANPQQFRAAHPIDELRTRAGCIQAASSTKNLEMQNGIM